MKFIVWCDSGADHQSCREEVVELSDLNLSEQEWTELSDEERGAVMKKIALANLDWGFAEIK